MSDLAYAPVAAGVWRQHELWDGTYTFDDLLDIMEVLQVKGENERRSWDANKAQK